MDIIALRAENYPRRIAHTADTEIHNTVVNYVYFLIIRYLYSMISFVQVCAGSVAIVKKKKNV